MNARPMTTAGPDIPWELPTRGRVGMLSFIAAESAIFVIFVVAYLYYVGKSLTGPMPKDVLTAPVFITVCVGLLDELEELKVEIAVARRPQHSHHRFAVFVLESLEQGERLPLPLGAHPIESDHALRTRASKDDVRDDERLLVQETPTRQFVPHPLLAVHEPGKWLGIFLA